jgi:hypothetical protein
MSRTLRTAPSAEFTDTNVHNVLARSNAVTRRWAEFSNHTASLRVTEYFLKRPRVVGEACFA